jgi:uncharacterized phage protein gp47/JayE
MIPAPKINKHRFEDILREVKALIPFYTLEWKPPEEKSPDIALIKIFSHMMETIITRLNRVPDNNLIAFLDMLGIKLIPAQSARAPVTFLLSEGATENVTIPKRSQAAAGELIFETENNFVATPAKLTDAYSINIDKDGIFKSPLNIIEGKTPSSHSTRLTYKASKGDTNLFLDDVSGIEQGDVLTIGETEYVMVSQISDTSVSTDAGLTCDLEAATSVEKITVFELFEGKNVQEHILYLGHKDLFNIKPSQDLSSSLTLSFKILQAAEPSLTLEWSYWGENKDTKKEEWIAPKSVSDSTSGFTQDGEVILSIGSEVKETEVNGIKSRWLRCRVKDTILKKDTKLPVVGAISVGTGKPVNGLVPEMAFYNDVPLDLTLKDANNFKEVLYPFGKKPRLFDTFYLGSQEAFSKKGAGITLTFSVCAEASIPVEEIYGIGPKFAARLKAPNFNINTVSELLKHTPAELMKILQTNKQDLVLNILAAAKKKFIEASRTGGRVDAVAAATTQEEPALSWEYWNGKGWTVIKEGVTDNTDRFLDSGAHTFVFTCPSDIEATRVSGQENYWIRVRIVSGDYGKELIHENEKWIPGEIKPPAFSSVIITYSLASQNLEQCLIYNNLEFVNITEENKALDKTFKPFRPLDDERQTLYLGFDKKLESGPISIFFAIEEAKYTEQTMPVIVWEYFSGEGQSGEWTRLEVLDGTSSLTRSGTIEFVVARDFAATTKFGSELYWIRALDAQNVFKSIQSVIESNLPIFQGHAWSHPEYVSFYSQFFIPKFSDISHPNYPVQPQPQVTNTQVPGENKPENTGKEGLQEEIIEPCPPYIEVFHPSWLYPAEVRKYALKPKISGIYLNTTYAIQTETISGEIMGSSDGTANQNFSLTKTPVTSEEIWVDELNALSETQMKDMLTAGEPETEAVTDDEGNITKFWVKWQAVDYLLASSKDDRHYEIDETSGSVIFGDGINGAIPPVGTDNIKADYRSGGGKSGNVEKSTITTLKTSLPFVDKVSNPVSGGGGSDTEVTEAALERGPQTVRHRDRAVSRDDFEWVAKQASPGLARVKCLPDFNNNGEYEPGWVTVMIVPQSEDTQPAPSLELLSKVEKYLKNYSANTVVGPEQLQVSGPVYVAVSVEADIASTSMDAIPLVEKEACTKLKEFLHPLTGGYEKKGWDLGRMPYLSDFFSLLEKIPGVDYVKDLSVMIKAAEKPAASQLVMTTERATDIEIPPYTLVFSGEHKITVTYK